MKVAILDDYQNVSMILGNFEKLKKDFNFQVFNQPFENEDHAIEQLKDFEVLLVMRERTPITKKIIFESDWFNITVMTIKTKLQLGLLFLFGVIVLLGGMGMYYLNQLKEESTNILTDNYESISYVQKMQESLDLNTQTDSLAMITFEADMVSKVLISVLRSRPAPKRFLRSLK